MFKLYGASDLDSCHLGIVFLTNKFNDESANKTFLGRLNGQSRKRLPDPKAVKVDISEDALPLHFHVKQSIASFVDNDFTLMKNDLIGTIRRERDGVVEVAPTFRRVDFLICRPCNWIDTVSGIDVATMIERVRLPHPFLHIRVPASTAVDENGWKIG